MADPIKDPMDVELEELEQALEEQSRREALARKKVKILRMRQQLVDNAAYEKLCDEYGISSLRKLEFDQVIDGIPTFIVVKSAPRDHLKIYNSRVLKAPKEKGGHPSLSYVRREVATLGKACIVYPDSEVLEAMQEHVPDLEVHAGKAGRDMAAVEAQEEGKG
jgi:hypothetical protein